jgi:hypothetical protein
MYNKEKLLRIKQDLHVAAVTARNRVEARGSGSKTSIQSQLRWTPKSSQCGAQRARTTKASEIHEWDRRSGTCVLDPISTLMRTRKPDLVISDLAFCLVDSSRSISRAASSSSRSTIPQRADRRKRRLTTLFRPWVSCRHPCLTFGRPV